MSRTQNKQTKAAEVKPDPQARRIAKLIQQIRRFEEKGSFNTPHHRELERLQNPPVRDATRDTEE